MKVSIFATLRGYGPGLLAVDFIETVTLAGARMYILALVEHASRRVRVLGATARPTAAWVTQGRPQPRHGP
jgi:hypothetical protein